MTSLNDIHEYTSNLILLETKSSHDKKRSFMVGLIYYLWIIGSIPMNSAAFRGYGFSRTCHSGS